MQAQLPRWSRKRAERLQARGTSDVKLYHIFRSGSGKAKAQRVHTDGLVLGSDVSALPISGNVDSVAGSPLA